MNWNNLKNGKCPKCGGWLTDSGTHVVCTVKECGFTIRQERMKEILDDQYRPHERSQDERNRDWNNYGVKPPENYDVE